MILQSAEGFQDGDAEGGCWMVRIPLAVIRVDRNRLKQFNLCHPGVWSVFEFYAPPRQHPLTQGYGCV